MSQNWVSNSTNFVLDAMTFLQNIKSLYFQLGNITVHLQTINLLIRQEIHVSTSAVINLKGHTAFYLSLTTSISCFYLEVSKPVHFVLLC
jgi:hypothetical protein